MSPPGPSPAAVFPMPSQSPHTTLASNHLSLLYAIHHSHSDRPHTTYCRPRTAKSPSVYDRLDLRAIDNDHDRVCPHPTMDTWWFYPTAGPHRTDPSYPQDPEDYRLSCLGLPLSLPYEVETLGEMDERLEVIACRLVECVKAREWGLGFRMWDSALSM